MQGDYLVSQRVDVIRCTDEHEDIWRITDARGVTHHVYGYDFTPHPALPMTNTEFVTLVMERSRSGVLMQAFILQAIEQMALATMKATAEELDTPFISGETWRNTAAEALGWFAARDFAEKSPAG